VSQTQPVIRLNAGRTQQADSGVGLAEGRPRHSTTLRSNFMNKDQVKGAIKDAAGKVQQQTGKVIGSTEQQVKGLVKQVEGKVQKSLGDVKEAVKDASHK
jgi:uncharacterized protein YjbJ (UPF0337 family)